MALGLLGISGWLAGTLAYPFGVRVVDQAEAFAGPKAVGGVQVRSGVFVDWGGRANEETTVAKKPVHVTPHKDGWAVIREGTKRATSVHPTQKAAADVGRELARRDKTEFVLHGKDGEIRKKGSHGRDPHPPKG